MDMGAITNTEQAMCTALFKCGCSGFEDRQYWMLAQKQCILSYP